MKHIEDMEKSNSCFVDLFIMILCKRFFSFKLHLQNMLTRLIIVGY